MQLDPDVFMQTAVTGASSTRVEQADPGEYTAVVDELEFNTFPGRKDPSRTFSKLRVKWSLDDAALKEKLGRNKITVSQDMFLDVTDSGILDMREGKNVSLGRLREAVGQNAADRPWAPNMLVGAVAKVRVEHEVVNGAVYASVTGTTKL